MTTDTVLDQKTTTTRKLKEPKKYKAVVMNDNFTPMEFVVSMLVSVFRQSEASAVDLTMQIHNQGSAIAGIYPYEVAEQKVSDAVALARANGHPLIVKTEQE